MTRHTYDGRWALGPERRVLVRGDAHGPELYVWWPIGGHGYHVELYSPADGSWHGLWYSATPARVRRLLKGGVLMSLGRGFP